MTKRREGAHIMDLVERYAPPSYDPHTDDMTVAFAILLAEKDREIERLRAERDEWQHKWMAIAQASLIIGTMRLGDDEQEVRDR